MHFPIYCGFIAPDIAQAKPLHGFKTALDLAEKLGGQITVAVGAIRMSVPNLLSSATVEGLIAEENRRSNASAAAAAKAISAMAERSSITVHTQTLNGDFSQLRSGLTCRARIHGLIVAEAGIAGDFLASGLVESYLFESGRPVAVVPEEFAGPIVCERIVIAWDGSAGAARAVWDAMPLLRLAKDIDIVTVTGEKNLKDSIPASELAASLNFLGKRFAVTPLRYDNSSAAGCIKAHAAKTGAGLIVQGAYGRSRWSELVLGGVTREMLRDPSVPVMMSH